MGHRTGPYVSNGDGTETNDTKWCGWNWGDVIGIVFCGFYLAIMVFLGLVCNGQ